jgi:hypothetical protein
MIDTKLSSLLLLSITTILPFCGITSYCQDASRADHEFRHSQEYTSTLADLYAKLKPVFEKYYPSATMTNKGANGLHFEYAVTNFDFSTPPRPGAGAKRENPIQRGPKHGGILCSVYLEKGKYHDQRIISFTPVEGGELAEFVNDRKEYRELVLAPYSKKRDAYLWVVLSYPPDATDEFLKELRKVVKSFSSDAK